MAIKKVQLPDNSTQDINDARIASTDITQWNGKQDALVPGENIKTVNGESLLGSGDLTITGEPGDDGVGIASVVQTTESTESGGTNVITVTNTDGTTSTFKVRNGDAVGSATIVQTTGDSTTAAMSQDAVTRELLYNTHAQFGTSIQFGSDFSHYGVLELTQKQIELLNASEVMSVRFVLRDGLERPMRSNEWRYMVVDFMKTNIKTNANGRMFVNDVDYGSSSSWLNKFGSEIIYPDVFTVVINRVKGEVKFYDKTTLRTTLTAEGYKSDGFVDASKGIILISGGDYRTRFYDISVYDADISLAFTRNTVSNFEQITDGAGLWSNVIGNFALSNGSFTQTISVHGSGSGWTVTNNGATRTYKNSTTTSNLTAGHYIPGDGSNSGRLRIWETDIEVVSGVIALSADPSYYGSPYLTAIDSNGDEVADLSNIGVGTYTFRGMIDSSGCWRIARVSGDVEVIETERRYKFVSCCIHMKGDALYNGQLYDDEAEYFYPLISDIANVAQRTGKNIAYLENPILLSAPLRSVRLSIAQLPHYAGELAVYLSNSNVYIGMPNYTWKQINNS